MEYHGSGLALTFVGLFQYLAPWSATIPEFIPDLTISGDFFRRLVKSICLLDTSASSALGILYDDCAISLTGYVIHVTNTP